ncbi:putative transposase [Streptomyces sp. SAI-135]|uniref:DDE-type integrase/transposase/recombinase n=1 Tax=unclassified Streptomyces TaxID=2593676 RepID=UPI002474FC5A|nr:MULTISPECIES: DDE-type integrase/transposase/recombinase [unclassified Streptomyces]MDH6522993.1 putative transposase [Streptomyces sp. SAI-090]MDH6554611.1 putative transposase [Streptomyces sp. SAI-041]MDH6573876.1 putative transposase [Streptomyces sp. SAI-117]MDH6581388.1 putative transposase [Streptomyces sp. SAI-133]MDH6613394.1 putative transposase [Streptomyces sp. SAI-135]
MRERDNRGVTRRKRRSLTRSDKKATPAPDRIGRDFHAERPGIKLVGDITHLPTAEGSLYLACWLDLVTREVIGCAMADHHCAELVIDALDTTHGRGGLESGCVVHSDRGSEYTSAQFRAPAAKFGAAEQLGLNRIMLRQRRHSEFLGPAQGRDRHPHLARQGRRPRRGLRLIETFYNRRRLRMHDTFGHLTPAKFEHQLTCRRRCHVAHAVRCPLLRLNLSS